MSLPKAFLLLALAVASIAATGTSEPLDEFLSHTFSGSAPSPSVHWMTAEDRQVASEILGHDYRHLRQRYWERDGRTAWIVEEIGKEQPITVGIVVAKPGIETLQVLVYREDRGGEVRYSFFTDQFEGARLENDLRLSRRIDGISGATLSVRALTGLSRLALYLHGQVMAESSES